MVEFLIGLLVSGGAVAGALASLYLHYRHWKWHEESAKEERAIWEAALKDDPEVEYFTREDVPEGSYW